MGQSGSLLPLVLIVLLVLFSVYRRVRRSIGFQVFSAAQLRTRMVIFAVLGALLLVTAYTRPIAVIGDVVGLVIGLILAYYAGRTTVFERRGSQLMYRTHPWIGALVIALFVLRLAYRFVELGVLTGQLQHGTGSSATVLPSQSYSNDPFTTGFFLLMVGYYLGYFTFLLRKAQRVAVAAESGEGEAR